MHMQCTVINITVNVPVFAKKLIFNCWPDGKLTIKTTIKHIQLEQKKAGENMKQLNRKSKLSCKVGHVQCRQFVQNKHDNMESHSIREDILGQTMQSMGQTRSIG